jgi:glycine dehydrogenase
VGLEDSVLRNAPHTAATLVNEWSHPYSRREAVFPAGERDKYWPPVRRIDNAYGDRNLHCTCGPVDGYS